MSVARCREMGRGWPTAAAGNQSGDQPGKFDPVTSITRTGHQRNWDLVRPPRVSARSEEKTRAHLAGINFQIQRKRTLLMDQFEWLPHAFNGFGPWYLSPQDLTFVLYSQIKYLEKSSLMCTAHVQWSRWKFCNDRAINNLRPECKEF